MPKVVEKVTLHLMTLNYTKTREYNLGIKGGVLMEKQSMGPQK